MNITLRQLVTFSSVEKFGSFVQAAKSLNLTQAALSHQLRELEESLGFRLFHRTTRSVKLTMEGKVFLPYATRILTNIDSATECAAALSQGVRGVVRICTTEALASTHVMAAVASFQEANPDIQVLIVEALSDTLVSYLEDDRADIALGPERPAPDSVACELIFQVNLVALCSRSHPFATRKSLAWADLKDQQLLFAAGGGRLSITKAINKIIDFKERGEEIMHFTTMLAQASIGKHIAITTQYLEPFLPIYGLKAIPLMKPQTRRKVMLYTSRKYHLSKVAGLFVEHLKARLCQ